MKSLIQTHERIELHLQETAKRFSTACAISEWDGFAWQDITYQSLLEQALQFSKELCERDITPGERVVLVSHNRIEAVVALLGIWFAKATVVLIDPDLPESDFLYQYKMADARFVVMEENNKTVLNADYYITLSNKKFDWKNDNKTESKTVFQDCDANLAAIVFTSGTTGFFKGVMLSHANFIYLVGCFKTVTPESGCALTVFPFFHVAGLFSGLLYPLLLGFHIVLFRTFSAEALQLAFIDFQPTAISVVPRLLEVLDQKIKSSVLERGVIAKRLFPLLFNSAYFLNRFCHINMGRLFFRTLHKQFGGKLKSILCGSAALSPQVQKQFLSYGFDVLLSYGLTETGGAITLTPVFDRWKEGSVGVCADKNDLSVTTEGEITYKGAALMRGYFRDPEATTAIVRNGVLYTGDLGKIDRSGNLFISGRIKELIVFSDGKKAMPEQMEKHYADIMGVKEYAIFGVNKMGETLAVLAFVADEKSNFEKIKKTLFQRASKLKSPYRIADVLMIDSIPRSSTLKIKRNALLEQYHDKMTLQFFDTMSDRKTAVSELILCFQSLLSQKKEFITEDITFAELGIDSLLAAQLCELINVKFQTSLNPTVFWFAHSIRELHRHLLSEKKIKSVKLPADAKNKIAIVALDCVLPGAADSFVFWENLMSGKDSIIEVPKSRWHIEDYYDPYRLAPGKINSRYGGFIPFPHDFPHDQFNIKSRIADMMDPQQKILLMMTKRLLRKCDSLKNANTGLFLGAAFPEFIIHSMKKFSINDINAYSAIGMADFSLVSRIAFHFGLEGPALLINTACSSSLVAVHQAVRALQAGDCDAAIAGGINFMLEPDVSIGLTKGGFLSPEGRCKTFDAQANGYVRSEGCGLVLLKRYEDAVDAGDKILGVIVGSAINQDGASNGITAPSGMSQIHCYQAALRHAGIAADNINYIEAHGTGTQLGDAIEMKSIQFVYDQNRAAENPLFVGAVKSSIGHCEAASGIAGLIKTIAVLNNQLIPPNLHYYTPNPHITLSSAVQLPVQLTRFPKRCDYAAVSSFGIAGTNAHVIIQTNPPGLWTQ
ncbi:MAG: AMP-binding protein [Gammaproteobacteria bacterium]|nr:AMP-binding protein [Gammaproteobacteria bacterium]